MKRSIGSRIINSFLIIILLTVSIIDILLITGYRQYYYNTVENNLRYRVDNAQAIYQENYKQYSIENFALENVSLLPDYVEAEVQIIDTRGNVLSDSLGVFQDNVLLYTDVQKALNGKITSRVGTVEYSDDSVMSLSAPLKDQNGDINGLIRLNVSLSKVNSQIRYVAFLLVAISLLIIGISLLASIVLAKSIVRPIDELTAVAEEMANGHYKVRANLNSNDELGKLGYTLNTLAEEILKKDQIKNDFISSISHELRTPLTSIKGWASILMNLNEDEIQLYIEGLDIIQNESDRLAKMVEELLDFSRYISGRITLDKDIFNLATTCSNVCMQMEPKADMAHVQLSLEIQNSVMVYIGDENRIKQLLINLLDNAIKFTEENGWIKLTSYVDENDYIILVSDNGVGMSKEELDHVKEKFYKGKHSKSHSGIGLSIADEIVKLHGGHMDIFSEENVGTTIKISLPYDKNVEVKNEA